MDSRLFSIEGKTILVTGGARGIGLMIVKAFVEAGARVYISSRKKTSCDLVAHELGRVGECISIPADLSQLEEVERLSALIKESEKGLDVLVNNAGSTWGAPLQDFPEKGWDKVMDLNLKSPFFLIQKLLPLLESASKPEDPSRIINIGSVDGLHTPLFENFSYAASKAGFHHLSRFLSSRLASRNINVNVIAPGPFDTDMMRPMLESMGDTRILANVPMKRLGTEHDAAGVAIFLASKASAYITGAVLPVDGGLSGAI